MHALEDQLSALQGKLQQLVKQYQSLQKENARLREDLEKTGQALQDKTTLVEQLQHQLTARNLQAGNWSAEEKKQLEARINAYLKEIEKCLTLLNA